MQTRTKSVRHRASSSNHEAGFMLVFVVLLAALILIALAAAAPVVAKDLRRDKEVESAHRANEYVRAIRLYYRKFKTYPPSIEALENTNNIRFLRKQYVDPLTGKADWRIIHVGENKTTVKGFFGQPLGGLSTTGAGGGFGSSSGFGGTNSSASSSSTVSGGSALASGFQGATIGGSTPGPSGGGTPGSTNPNSGGGTSNPATSNSGTSNSSTSSSSSSSGGVGQVMGVGTARTGDSIMDPNEQTTYETWEFLYDPRIELLYAQANILGGGAGTMNSQPASSLGSSPGQSNTPGGSNNSTPTAPTRPNYPQ